MGGALCKSERLCWTKLQGGWRVLQVQGMCVVSLPRMT